MSLTAALQNAISGLQVAQRALDVTAQNISNANTEGYSRKEVSQEAVILGGRGAGVAISDVLRAADALLLKDLGGATSELEERDARSRFYDRMQDLFGTPGSNQSISAKIAEFANQAEALATSPEDLSAVTELVSQATLLAEELNRLGSQVQAFRLQADREIGTSIDVINGELTDIEQLNIQIGENTNLGREVGDLLDQRDRALQRISEQIDINYFFRGDNQVVIFTAEGQTLLDRTAKMLSHSTASSVNADVTYAGGTIDGIDLNGSDITSQIASGKIAALVEMRDTVLPDLYAQLGAMAQELHDVVNGIHNLGAGFPGVDQLTGTRSFAATDAPDWSGEFRIATLDSTGAVTETQDFDLAGYATINDLVTAIDAMGLVSASLDASGRVVVSTITGHNIAITDLDSSVEAGAAPMTAPAFLGLNDFFTSDVSYTKWVTAQQSTSTAAIGLAGSLTFSVGGATTVVNYAAGDSLSDIADSINLDATLTGNNIQATVEVEGSGYRLRIADTTGAVNFFVTDSSTLSSSLGLKARSSAMPETISVRSDIANDPSRVSRGQLSTDPALAVGDIGLTTGDNAIAQQLATTLSSDRTFGAVGTLAGGSRSFAEQASAVVALNATQARNAETAKESQQFLRDNLSFKVATISGVNVDEEMANMIVLENAYAASARVITVTQKLFDVLNDIVG